MSNQSSQHLTGDEPPKTKGINKRKRDFELWAKLQWPWRENYKWYRLGRYRTPAERDIAKESYQSKYRFYTEFANERPE